MVIKFYGYVGVLCIKCVIVIFVEFSLFYEFVKIDIL